MAEAEVAAAAGGEKAVRGLLGKGGEGEGLLDMSAEEVKLLVRA